MNRKLKTKWYQCSDETEIHELVALLKVGDLLEFQRTGYSHWAVYVNLPNEDSDDTTHNHPAVIHRCIPADATRSSLLKFSATSSMGGEENRIGAISIEMLETIIKNETVRINNELDKMWEPFDPGEIVARAKHEMNKPKPDKYYVVTNNCEHFVNKCRYGRRESRQVKQMAVDAVVSIAGTLSWVARAALVVTSISVPIPATVGLVVAGGVVSATPWIIRVGKLIHTKVKKPSY